MTLPPESCGVYGLNLQYGLSPGPTVPQSSVPFAGLFGKPYSVQSKHSAELVAIRWIRPSTTMSYQSVSSERYRSTSPIVIASLHGRRSMASTILYFVSKPSWKRLAQMMEEGEGQAESLRYVRLTSQ